MPAELTPTSRTATTASDDAPARRRAFAFSAVDFAIGGALNAGIEPDDLLRHVEGRLDVGDVLDEPIESTLDTEQDRDVPDLMTALEASLAAVRAGQR